MKKLVLMGVACAFVSTAAFAQVPQNLQQGAMSQQNNESATPQQGRQATNPAQQQEPQNNQTYPEQNNQSGGFPQGNQDPLVNQQKGYNVAPSDTTHPKKKKDATSVDTTQKVDTSGAGHNKW